MRGGNDFPTDAMYRREGFFLQYNSGQCKAHYNSD